MPDIRKSLLQFVFAGAFMKRWNDKLRPMELMEMDKQAHKMMTAWVLFEINSRGLSQAERLALGEQVIEGGLFEYFYRLIITDIKPPIFYKIKANPDHYRRLTSWVLDQLGSRVQPLGKEFFERMEDYLCEPQPETLAGRILQAAHLYASSWEFKLIKGANAHNWDDELQEIDDSFKTSLARLEDLPGVAELNAGKESALGRFAHLAGHLRFQKRWSQTPRIPETSVIGHMFLVACYAYFFSLALETCQARRVNNFFAGLFHDLPELLTRDIISPVKKSVRDIAELIKEYESQELRRLVLDPLDRAGYADLTWRLGYFLGLEAGSEFADVILPQGRGGPAERVDLLDEDSPHDCDELDPKDGEMLKVCDILAAFMEAYTTLRNGIQNDQLQQALWRIRQENQHKVLAGRLHIGALLADFD